MKEDLVEILCCPVCKEELKLKVIERKDDEILSGTLTCVKCASKYPISEGIPDLLPKQ